jgi:hypothetical protein
VLFGTEVSREYEFPVTASVIVEMLEPGATLGGAIGAGASGGMDVMKSMLFHYFRTFLSNYSLRIAIGIGSSLTDGFLE